MRIRGFLRGGGEVDFAATVCRKPGARLSLHGLLWVFVALAAHGLGAELQDGGRKGEDPSATPATLEELVAAVIQGESSSSLDKLILTNRVYTMRDYDEGWGTWLSNMWMASYAECGIRSNAWDGKTDQMIREYVTMRTGSDTNAARAVVALASELDALQCPDPIVPALHGTALLFLREYAKAEPVYLRALDGLEKSRYPRIHLHGATANLLVVADQLKRDPKPAEENGVAAKPKARTRGQLKADQSRYLAEACGDPAVRNGGQRYLLDLIQREIWADCSSAEPNRKIIELMDGVPDSDSWLKLMAEAFYDIRKAWAERGGGWASTVTRKGWKGYEDNLKKARACLVAAYKLHPEYPEAAAKMIEVEMGSGGNVRMWFERAVLGQFDYMPAYRSYLWAIRPRWGGSHEEMYELGQECLRTKRFDTEVPGFFRTVVHDIGSELEDWRDIYKRAGVYESLKALHENTPPAALARGSGRGKQCLAVEAWAAGRYGDARTLMRDCGDRLDPEVAKYYAVFAEEMLGETCLLSGPCARDALALEEAFARKRDAKLLPRYESVLAKLGDDPAARRVVNDRIAALRLGQEFMEGKTVSLSASPDLAGWRILEGEWRGNPTNAISCRINTDSYEPLILCRARFGGNFEIAGEAEAPRGWGVVLGYKKEMTKSLLFFGSGRDKDAILLASCLCRNEISVPFPVKGKNTFRVQVWNRRVTAFVNDKAVFSAREIPSDWWDPEGGLIGVGGLAWNGPYTATYFNLTIRRLTEQPPDVVVEEGGKADTAKGATR